MQRKDRYQLNTVEPFSADAEATLTRNAQSGDIEARNQLVESMIPWVIHLAGRFHDRIDGAIDLHDLIQWGNIGLMTAVDRLDPCKGRLSTYSRYWIQREMWSAYYQERRHGLTLSLDDLGGNIAAPEQWCEEYNRMEWTLRFLHDRERDIIMSHFYGESFHQIGRRLDRSAARIRQIFLAGVEKLRWIQGEKP